jgi:phage-related protein (TIGR01555 family)
MSNKVKAFTTKVKDGMQNFVSNLGTQKDKRYHSRFYRVEIDREELLSMYTTNWIAGKTVDIPVDDMLRNWRQIKTPSLSPSEIEEFEQEEDKLQVREMYGRAGKWARLYGGSVILLGLDGTGPLDTPLDVTKVKKGALKFLHVLDRHDLGTGPINTTDPTKANFRLPEFYRIIGSSQQIHYTRLIRFDGLDVPWRARIQNRYWGLSILQRVYDAIINAQTVSDSIASMTYESSIDVVKVPNLFQYLASPGGTDKVIERFALADIVKSTNNMLIIDSTEEYEKSTTQFGALPDIMTRFLNAVAAAADIPATRMLGQSAQGLNATGEHDLFNYFNMVQSKQETELAPQLRYLDEILTRSVYGHKPDDWSFEFNSLWQSPPSALATIEVQRAQRDEIYMRNGVVTGSIVGEQLREDGTYHSIDDEYLEVLEEIDEEKANEPEEPAEPFEQRQPPEVEPTKTDPVQAPE